MFHFEHPYWLQALAALPVMGMLYIWLLQWKKRTVKKIGDDNMVRRLVQDYSSRKFFRKFLLVAIAYTAGVIALANPRLPGAATAEKRSGIDVMIALDVSRSMLAQDISPSRLERARQMISRLVEKLNGDRIGLVYFAGRAYLQMPLTNDNAAAKMFLAAASPDAVPVQGTVIGNALQLCYAAFNSTEKKYKAVVLISDGEDHDEGAIKTAKAMADEGIIIHCIGAGTTTGAAIPDGTVGNFKKDASGNTVITKLDESVLKTVAIKANGMYQPLHTADETATAIYNRLQQMEKHSTTAGGSVQYSSLYQWFVWLAILLLVFEIFVSEKISKTAKPVAGKLATIVLPVLFFCTMPLAIKAQNAGTYIQQGNAAYSEGRYDDAADKYNKATLKDTASTKAWYNLGNALYKSGHPEEALQAYDAAISKDTAAADKAATWYNKGVVLQNNKKLPECIEAYKNALRLNPNDEDARLNLQKALQQQQQQQQQQKQQQNKKDQQQQQNKKQQKPAAMPKKEAEEKLKALLQHEKNLQEKLRRMEVNAPERPEKDW
ncbi:MAG TPA: VWA domain-containing protein [Ferruginibacter sp.]|nr:VWA domain-containing protein [Ferruginibacter sp.]HMP21046.1 VWA domain-containing protein [Ferruginibacter sp.]